MEAIFQLVEAKGRWMTVGVLVLLLSWESLAPFFGFFRGDLKHRSLHAVRNFAMGVINSLMIAAVFVAAWLWAAELAYGKKIGILYFVDLPNCAHAVGAILLLDFWTYWFHRMSHRVPFIWKFHRVHHSDNRMDVTTATRFHFGELFISSVLRTGIILLFGVQLWHVALYELIMFPIVQFHHANVGVPAVADRWLRALIVTPAMHKVHHSRLQPETDSNYTSMLSIWDRLFGSFRLRDNPHEIEFGLDHYDEPKSQGLTGMLGTPFHEPMGDAGEETGPAPGNPSDRRPEGPGE